MTGALMASILGGLQITLPALVDIQDSRLDPTDATANVRLTNGGDIQSITTGGNTDIGDWVIPKILFSSFEARMTTISGTLDTGTAGVWENLGTTRTWGIDQTAVGVNNYSGTLEIRNAASLVVMDSCPVSLTAEVTI